MLPYPVTIGYDVSSIFGRNGIARGSREVLRGLSMHDGIGMRLVGTWNQRTEMQELFPPKQQLDVRLTLTHERALGAPLRRLVRLYKKHEIKHVFDGVDLVHYPRPQKVFAQHHRVISTVHDLIPMYAEYAVERGLRYRFPRMLERQLRKSHALVCPSAWVANTIKEKFPWFKGGLTVTPLAASGTFRPSELSDEVRRRYKIEGRYLVYVGRIDVARKNLDRILEAWMRLSPQYRFKTRFVVVTDRSDVHVQRFINNLSFSLDNSVDFLTTVSTTDLVQIISNARGMVFASQAEGFGLPILEAMQCGCPVITSSTSSMPEVAGDAAIYVEPQRVDSIADAMTKLLDDDELYALLREQGLARSRCFSWTNTAERTLRAYQECLEM